MLLRVVWHALSDGLIADRIQLMGPITCAGTDFSSSYQSSRALLVLSSECSSGATFVMLDPRKCFGVLENCSSYQICI